MTAEPSPAAGRYRVAHLHQPGGWFSPGYVEITPDGRFGPVAPACPADWQREPASLQDLTGYVVPGMANLHSHTHQRGLAGHAEGIPRATHADFWSWRDRMYAFANRLTPDDLEAIAAQAFVEMLTSGYTAVGEFHYLHHDPGGAPYANPAELSERVIAAAEQAGIALTLLPALYTQGGIGRPDEPGQRRFVHTDVERYLRLIEHIRGLARERALLHTGIAPHSLRAVAPTDLRVALDAVHAVDPAAPVHIHAAEQQREVREVQAGLGARPVEWLLANVALDRRWTLIHATHITPAERQGIAAARATVGLCPITEANLGDGLFPLVDYTAEGGAWGVGTDSNVAVSLTGELAMLDYGQRLFRQQRDTVVMPGTPETEQPGRRLFDLALEGGWHAVAQPAGAIAPGRRADLVQLDPDAISLAGRSPETVLDGWVFGPPAHAVRRVMVAGTWVVDEGRHAREEAIRERFTRVIRALLG